MTLSAPKQRTRISEDPNNLTWSRCTTRYGHRILEAQGWTPGHHLDANKAPRSSEYGSANAGRLRLVLEGGNAGLGAGRGREQTETYGLSGFQGILGRLNGKSDREVKKEAITQRDIQLRLYTGQRYGFLNFVSGGLLVGDTIRPKERKGENGFSTGTQIRTTEQPPKLASAVSQRKHRSEEAANPARMEKRSKKSQKAEEAIPDSDGENSGKEEEAKRVRKKERRQKRAEKEARRRRRQERRLEKQGQRGAEASRDRQRSKSLSLPSDTVSLKTPKASIHRGQAVRRRYIHQKRLASSNTQALNEIFMIKA